MQTEIMRKRAALKASGVGPETIASGPDVLANGFHGYKQGYETVTNNKLSKQIRKFMSQTIVPLFLILAVPNLVIILWYSAMKCNGSYAEMASVFYGRSFKDGMFEIWKDVRISSKFTFFLLVGYCSWAALLMKLLPGKNVTGPITPKGNTPIYTDNGFLHYVVTMVTFAILTVVLKQFGFSPSIVYDRFDEVLTTLNIFSLIFCLMLYLKGIYAPSSTDCGSSGNFIFDYYWGTELYPRILGFDIKVFTNCRFGMTVWALLVGVCAVKSYELHGFVDSMFVSSFLQLAYISKFFWWEAGYMRTIDIMLDRAGFYICWGCLVYVPSLYASVSLYLVNNPVQLGYVLSIIFLCLGLLSIYINYLADWQKQEVRYANGNCLVWGKKPNIIRAKYTLDNGEEKESILLASGWWGLSRHFHYIPEIMLAFFWSVPALFNHVMPYSYVIWLLILLTHRSYRDDKKCGQKYGMFWREYCQKVPHRIVPHLF